MARMLFAMAKISRQYLTKQKRNYRENILFSAWFQEKNHGSFKMTLYFKYRAVPQGDGIFSKIPLIPLVLIGKEIIITSGIIDSGADNCAVSKIVAEQLGLPFSGRREFTRGIGGVVESVQSRVIISFRQGNEAYKFNVPINIILKPGDFPVLLGQEGFFDKFIITFDRKEESFWLKKKGGLFS